MDRLTQKKNNEARRTHRVRTMISTGSDRLRLSVNISNRHIYAQIIDDTKGTTVVSVSTLKAKNTDNMTKQAQWVGQEIAKKAKAKKIKKVAFDRGSKLYHGRIKALADAARAEGLEF